MQAVILAGGEGKRLRPLTHNKPKPMVKLFSKPVLEHTLTMLEAACFDDAVLTLHYLPEEIRHCFGASFGSLRLQYSMESQPRGTAGAFNDAMRLLDPETPTFVISGDGVCCFDYGKILSFHQDMAATATVVCVPVKQPGEYGIVNTDEAGNILSFSEKPGWNRLDGSLANTGVYIIEPDVCELIPGDRPVDFAKDVFPALLSMETPFYAYEETGYWCDIGAPEAYKQCHNDIFDGKTTILLPELKKNIYSLSPLPAGNYTLIPPVYLGNNITVEDGAVIGPYTVLGDACFVGRNANIRKSVAGDGAFFGEDALVSDGVICDGASVRKGSRVFENALVGGQSVIGENSTVGSGVTVAAEKAIPKNTLVSESVTDGSSPEIIIENGSISGAAFTDMSVLRAAAVGAGFGSVMHGKYLAAACDGKNSSAAALSALCGGIISAGGNVWNFGGCFRAQFDFLLTYTGMNGGAFVSTDGGIITVSFAGEHGLPPGRGTVRELEYRLRRADFIPCNPEHCGSVRDMSYLLSMYRRQLGFYKNEYYGGHVFGVVSPNGVINNFVREFFGKSVADDARRPLFIINNEGTAASMIDEQGAEIGYEKLLTLAASDDFAGGSNVAVPFDAPKAISTTAAAQNCHIVRYCDEDDAAGADASALIAACVWARDALYLTVKLTDMCIRSGKTITQLVNALPEFSVYRRAMAVPGGNENTAGLLDHFRRQSSEKQGMGVRISYPKGDVLLTAADKGNQIRITAEATSAETAEELCGEIQDMISKLSEK